MKKNIIFVLIVLHHLPAFSQVDNVTKAANKETISNYLKEDLKPLEIDEFRILLHLKYGGADIVNKSDLPKLYSGEIKEINLYYSDFPKGKDFQALNKERIKNLLGLAEIAGDSAVTWRLIEQKDCASQIEAAKLFHGFEVILKFSKTIELTSLEIDTAFTDFVVEKVLARNGWKEMLIVSDMTGSMFPYISQLFLWLKLNTIDGLIKQFVFFNDGDTKLDKDKKIGKTGGLYQTKSNEYAEVEKVAIQSMLSGDGGDLQENDLEAVLTGLKLCPDCLENILIADNKSPVRDLSLMKQLKKPIRIIICGAEGQVNSEYLNLARATGGSIHLMEEDLFNLVKFNEGETLEINGVTYIIEHNKFIEIKRM